MIAAVAECIASRYASAGLIVEVGVGRAPQAALDIAGRGRRTRVRVTDIEPRFVRNARDLGLEAEVDDVLSPRLEVYQGADLLYSIRPPMELVPALRQLAQRARADLLVFPLSDEAPSFAGPHWIPVVDGGRVIGYGLSHLLSDVSPAALTATARPH